MAEESNDKTASGGSAEPQANGLTVPEVKRIEPGDGQSVGWFFRKRWWRNALMTAVYFAPKCYLAAVLWMLAGTVMVIGGWQSSIRMTGDAISSNPLATMMVAAAISMSTLVLTLVLTVTSVGLWLICLTAYVRSFMQLDIDSDQPLDRQETVSVQAAALHEVSHRKVYLAQFWVYVTLFLLLPFIVLMVGGFVEYLANVQMPKGIQMNLSPSLQIAILTVSALLSVFLTQVSFVATAVCGISKQEPLAAAKQSVKLSFKLFVPGFLLSTVILVGNIVIASPQLVLQLMQHQNVFAIKAEVVPVLIENVWQAVTSVVLWTFSGAPICQMLKGHIE